MTTRAGRTGVTVNSCNVRDWKDVTTGQGRKMKLKRKGVECFGLQPSWLAFDGARDGGVALCRL